MKLQGLSIEEVFKTARRAVLKATREGQIPWETSSITGDFFFRDRSNDEAAKPPSITILPIPSKSVDKRALELAFWKSIEESNNTAAFEAYLKRYPDGAFVTLAKIKLAELTEQAERKTKTRAIAPDPETDAGKSVPEFELTFWDSVKDSKKTAEFESYLKAFPNGKFRELAKLRIEQLKKPDPEPKSAPQPKKATTKTAPSTRQKKTTSTKGGLCKDGNMAHCKLACRKGYQKACARYQRGW